MKKITIALAAAAFTLGFTACESKLDIPQKGVMAQEDFYKTAEDAQSAMTSAYYIAGRFLSNTMWTSAGWNDSPLLSMWTYASDDIFVSGSDKTDGQSGQEIQSFVHTQNSGLITGTYECYYMIINACNLVICNFDANSPDPTIKRCVAEARVLRAQAQLLLALGWGTAPIVDHILAGDEKPGNAESQEYVLQWIADQCDEAIATGALTSKSNVNDKKGAVIVTKEFAYALKGKALLSKKDYAGAKTALKQVIDSRKYELVDGADMEILNHNSGRACKEVVFELNYQYDGSLGNYGRTQPNFRYLWGWRLSNMMTPDGPGNQICHDQGWGWCNPSKKFVDKILAYDGYNSNRRKAWIKSYDEVLYEMPYVSDEECTTLELKQADENRGINVYIYGNVGYFMWKRLFRAEDAVASDPNVANWNTNVMRYAEVLLMYAEACAMTSDGDGSGLKALKEINTRAGSATPVTALTMDVVKTEKFLECWLDGTRFQDLVRWGDCKKELVDDPYSGGKYYPTYKDHFFDIGATKTATHQGYIDESDADWCVKAKGSTMGFKVGKNELFPFPFAELSINPNLKQNPGYE